MLSRYWCWVIDVFLDVLSLLLCIAWWCGVFNDLWSWAIVSCMFSLCFFLISSFASTAASDSLGMLPSYFSFFIISPWLESVPVPVIHSWQGDINSKTPYSKMVHYHPWTEFGTSHRLGDRAQWLRIAQFHLARRELDHWDCAEHNSGLTEELLSTVLTEEKNCIVARGG